MNGKCISNNARSGKCVAKKKIVEKPGKGNCIKNIFFIKTSYSIKL